MESNFINNKNNINQELEQNEKSQKENSSQIDQIQNNDHANFFEDENDEMEETENQENNNFTKFSKPLRQEEEFFLIKDCLLNNEESTKAQFFKCPCIGDPNATICFPCSERCHKHHLLKKPVFGNYECHCGQKRHKITKNMEENYRITRNKRIECVHQNLLDLTEHKLIYPNSLGHHLCSICAISDCSSNSNITNSHSRRIDSKENHLKEKEYGCPNCVEDPLAKTDFSVKCHCLKHFEIILGDETMINFYKSPNFKSERHFFNFNFNIFIRSENYFQKILKDIFITLNKLNTDNNNNLNSQKNKELLLSLFQGPNMGFLSSIYQAFNSNLKLSYPILLNCFNLSKENQNFSSKEIDNKKLKTPNEILTAINEIILIKNDFSISDKQIIFKNKLNLMVFMYDTYVRSLLQNYNNNIPFNSYINMNIFQRYIYINDAQNFHKFSPIEKNSKMDKNFKIKNNFIFDNELNPTDNNINISIKKINNNDKNKDTENKGLSVRNNFITNLIEIIYDTLYNQLTGIKSDINGINNIGEVLIPACRVFKHFCKYNLIEFSLRKKFALLIQEYMIFIVDEFNRIVEKLEYEINQERNFSFRGLPREKILENLSSNIKEKVMNFLSRLEDISAKGFYVMQIIKSIFYTIMQSNDFIFLKHFSEKNFDKNIGVNRYSFENPDLKPFFDLFPLSVYILKEFRYFNKGKNFGSKMKFDKIDTYIDKILENSYGFSEGYLKSFESLLGHFNQKLFKIYSKNFLQEKYLNEKENISLNSDRNSKINKGKTNNETKRETFYENLANSQEIKESFLKSKNMSNNQIEFLYSKKNNKHELIKDYIFPKNNKKIFEEFLFINNEFGIMNQRFYQYEINFDEYKNMLENFTVKLKRFLFDFLFLEKIKTFNSEYDFKYNTCANEYHSAKTKKNKFEENFNFKHFLTEKKNQKYYKLVFEEFDNEINLETKRSKTIARKNNSNKNRFDKNNKINLENENEIKIIKENFNENDLINDKLSNRTNREKRSHSTKNIKNSNNHNSNFNKNLKAFEPVSTKNMYRNHALKKFEEFKYMLGFSNFFQNLNEFLDIFSRTENFEHLKKLNEENLTIILMFLNMITYENAQNLPIISILNPNNLVKVFWIKPELLIKFISIFSKEVLSFKNFSNHFFVSTLIKNVMKKLDIDQKKEISEKDIYLFGSILKSYNNIIRNNIALDNVNLLNLMQIILQNIKKISENRIEMLKINNFFEEYFSPEDIEHNINSNKNGKNLNNEINDDNSEKINYNKDNEGKNKNQSDSLIFLDDNDSIKLNSIKHEKFNENSIINTNNNQEKFFYLEEQNIMDIQSNQNDSLDNNEQRISNNIPKKNNTIQNREKIQDKNFINNIMRNSNIIKKKCLEFFLINYFKFLNIFYRNNSNYFCKLKNKEYLLLNMDFLQLILQKINTLNIDLKIQIDNFIHNFNLSSSFNLLNIEEKFSDYEKMNSCLNKKDAIFINEDFNIKIKLSLDYLKNQITSFQKNFNFDEEIFGGISYSKNIQNKINNFKEFASLNSKENISQNNLNMKDYKENFSNINNYYNESLRKNLPKISKKIEKFIFKAFNYLEKAIISPMYKITSICLMKKQEMDGNLKFSIYENIYYLYELLNKIYNKFEKENFKLEKISLDKISQMSIKILLNDSDKEFFQKNFENFKNLKYFQMEKIINTLRVLILIVQNKNFVLENFLWKRNKEYKSFEKNYLKLQDNITDDNLIEKFFNKIEENLKQKNFSDLEHKYFNTLKDMKFQDGNFDYKNSSIRKSFKEIDMTLNGMKQNSNEILIEYLFNRLLNAENDNNSKNNKTKQFFKNSLDIREEALLSDEEDIFIDNIQKNNNDNFNELNNNDSVFKSNNKIIFKDVNQNKDINIDKINLFWEKNFFDPRKISIENLSVLKLIVKKMTLDPESTQKALKNIISNDNLESNDPDWIISKYDIIKKNLFKRRTNNLFNYIVKYFIFGTCYLQTLKLTEMSHNSNFFGSENNITYEVLIYSVSLMKVICEGHNTDFQNILYDLRIMPKNPINNNTSNTQVNKLKNNLLKKFINSNNKKKFEKCIISNIPLYLEDEIRGENKNNNNLSISDNNLSYEDDENNESRNSNLIFELKKDSQNRKDCFIVFNDYHNCEEKNSNKNDPKIDEISIHHLNNGEKDINISKSLLSDDDKNSLSEHQSYVSKDSILEENSLDEELENEFDNDENKSKSTKISSEDIKNKKISEGLDFLGRKKSINFSFCNFIFKMLIKISNIIKFDVRNDIEFTAEEFKNTGYLVSIHWKFSDLFIEMIQGSEHSNFFYLMNNEEYDLINNTYKESTIKKYMEKKYKFIEFVSLSEKLLIKKSKYRSASDKNFAKILKNNFLIINNLLMELRKESQLVKFFTSNFLMKNILEKICHYMKKVLVRFYYRVIYEDERYMNFFKNLIIEKIPTDEMEVIYQKKKALSDDIYFSASCELFYYIYLLSRSFDNNEATKILIEKEQEKNLFSDFFSFFKSLNKTIYAKNAIDIKGNYIENTLCRYLKEIETKNNNLLEENRETKKEKISSNIPDIQVVKEFEYFKYFFMKFTKTIEFNISKDNPDETDSKKIQVLKKIHFMHKPFIGLLNRRNRVILFNDYDRTDPFVKVRDFINSLEYFEAEVKLRMEIKKKNKNSNFKKFIFFFMDFNYAYIDLFTVIICFIIHFYMINNIDETDFETNTSFTNKQSTNFIVNENVIFTLGALQIFVNYVFFAIYMTTRFYTFFIYKLTELKREKFAAYLHDKKDDDYFIEKLTFFEKINLYFFAFILNFEVNSMIINMLISSVSIIDLKYSLFFSLQFLTVCKYFNTVNDLSKALFTRFSQLIVMILFFAISCNFFAFFSLYFIHKFFDDLGTGYDNANKNPITGQADNTNYCRTLISCLTYLLDFMFRKNSEGLSIFYWQNIFGKRNLLLYFLKYWFEIFYFFLIVFLISNMINGVIITAFTSIREESYQKENDLMNKCFICSNDKFQFEKKGINFKYHIENEHNLKDYIGYIINLKSLPQNDLNSDEKYIYDMIKLKKTDVFPIEKAICLGN